MRHILGAYYAFVILSFLVSVDAGESFVTQFLDLVSGDIQGGNFSYFNLQHHGLVSLELISHSGDCDLYVSQFKTKPTFELGSYCLASSSCGLDKIIIPRSFKRPLAIGVYGHPSYENSAFTLNIYQISDASDADNETDVLYLTSKYANFQHYKEVNNPQDQSLFSNFISFIFSFWNFSQETWNYMRFLELEYGSNEHLILSTLAVLFG